jgi:DHA2 family multidrug resistance protein
MRINPWLIAILVSVATFMEVLDTTIANVALKYISGGLAVGPSEAAWTITSYLVANSIVLCASSWLAERLGRRAFFLACVATFTVSSILCGISWNLESLLLFRVLQGLAGGGMTPVAQSILADSFPPAKRGQAFAIYGVAVVVAPIVGPILGGYISDNYSWHWCFLINGPVGAVLFVLVYIFILETPEAKAGRMRRRRTAPPFDIVGFLLVATFLGALEVVLDKGQEDDWFGSTFIVVFAAASASAVLLFVPWALLKKEPVLDIRMLASRQFGACFLVMLGVGAILIATTQVVPQILQDNYGYTAELSGEALSPGGLVTMVMMFIVGRLGMIQPKYLIAAGAVFIFYGMYMLTSLDATSTFTFFALSRMVVGIGLPLMFLPITVASYDGLRASQTDQASSLINLARNFGGSIGVSVSQTVLARREQFHQAILSEHAGAWNPLYYQTLGAAKGYFASRPLNGGNAGEAAVGWIGEAVQAQASYLAYIDVFLVLSLMGAALAPLALTLRSVKVNNAPAGAH